jgi:hypothetical protein
MSADSKDSRHDKISFSLKIVRSFTRIKTSPCTEGFSLGQLPLLSCMAWGDVKSTDSDDRHSTRPGLRSEVEWVDGQVVHGNSRQSNDTCEHVNGVIQPTASKPA